MGDELGQVLRRVASGNRMGRLTMKRGKGATFNTSNRTGAEAPLLALIINARRGRAGLKGLYGKAMADEFRKVFGARARSIAYIKSGWIEAREIFKRFGYGGRGLPPSEGTGIGSGVKQVGAPKGGGQIA